MSHATTSNGSYAMTTTTNISAPSPTPTVDVTGSPLLKLIPYIYAAFSVVVSLLSFSLAIIKLVLSPLPIILYIITPITTFIDLTTNLFIRLPYRTFLYFADALYPLYVLFGVACITGCVFGYGGRLLVEKLVNSIVEVPSVAQRVEERRRVFKPRGRQEVKFEE